MNEQERVAYLRSMGYQVYYPRFVLPGAKPSPRYELPDGDEIFSEGVKHEEIGKRSLSCVAALAATRKSSKK